MKILQVVTYISPDGAYGGPVRVAINQAKALTQLGHQVTVAASAGGFHGPLPTVFDGYPVSPFPARRVIPKTGFAGITSPSLLMWLARTIPRADVVHIHLARDFVTLPAAAMAIILGKPLVVQTHGMVDRSDKGLAKILDRVLTRPVLKAARHVLYLTDREQKDLIAVAGQDLRLVHLPNGVPLPDILATEQVQGPAHAPEALYLARLHSRKRPMVFVRAAEMLSRALPHARFTLIGPDEGEGSDIRVALQNQSRAGVVTWSGPVPPNETLDRMREAAVYVLPSTDEPFPMAVLEAMSVGLPVIITDSCGLARTIQAHRAGIVCSDKPADVGQAMKCLLQDADLRQQMGSHGRQLIESSYSMSSVAQKLNALYEDDSNLRQVSI